MLYKAQSATTNGDEHGIYCVKWGPCSLKRSTPPKSSGNCGVVVLNSGYCQVHSPKEKMLKQRRQQLVVLLLVNFHTFICSVCAPGKSEDSTYEALKEKLDKQCGVEKLFLAEQYHFYLYKQCKTQSLTV